MRRFLRRRIKTHSQSPCCRRAAKRRETTLGTIRSSQCCEIQQSRCFSLLESASELRMVVLKREIPFRKYPDKNFQNPKKSPKNIGNFRKASQNLEKLYFSVLHRKIIISNVPFTVSNGCPTIVPAIPPRHPEQKSLNVSFISRRRDAGQVDFERFAKVSDSLCYKLESHPHTALIE